MAFQPSAKKKNPFPPFWAMDAEGITYDDFIYLALMTEGPQRLHLGLKDYRDGGFSRFTFFPRKP